MSNFDRKGIREVKTYMDGEGREVKEFVAVYGKDKEPTVYRGVAIRRMTGKLPNGREVTQNDRFEFPIADAGSVRAAFEKFDEVAKAELQAWEKKNNEQALASRVVGARVAPRAILGADGKSLPIRQG